MVLTISIDSAGHLPFQQLLTELLRVQPHFYSLLYLVATKYMQKVTVTILRDDISIFAWTVWAVFPRNFITKLKCFQQRRISCDIYRFFVCNVHLRDTLLIKCYNNLYLFSLLGWTLNNTLFGSTHLLSCHLFTEVRPSSEAGKGISNINLS